MARFLDGSLKLALVSTEGDEERPTGGRSAGHTEVEFRDIAERLQASRSRETAALLLHNEKLAGKNDLAKLARFLRIHVNKHDKREMIEDKIVEAVVGVRLRSEAIQGVNLKGQTAATREETPESEQQESGIKSERYKERRR